MYHTSVLRCFITSPDTPVCWILCVNYRFPCSLDRPIPTEIIMFNVFLYRHIKFEKHLKPLKLHRFLVVVAPITKILPQFLWGAKMPKIYAKCQKSMQKTWSFIFCHLNLVRAVYHLSFKLLVRSVAPKTKIVPPFLWFGGGFMLQT